MAWSSQCLPICIVAVSAREMSWVFPLLCVICRSKGTMWKWDSRVSKENFQIPRWEEGSEAQLVSWGTPCASAGGRADVFQLLLSLQTACTSGNTDSLAVHEERKHNEKTWKEAQISEFTEKFNFIFSDLNSRFKPYIILVLKNFLVILKIIFLPRVGEHIALVCNVSKMYC